MTGHEQPRQHPRRVGGQCHVGRRDALRHRRASLETLGRAPPKWTPRPGSRCARSAPDRRNRPRKPGRASECRSRCRRGTTPRRARSPSAHRRRPSIDVTPLAQASANAATSIGCWSNAGPVSPGPHPPAGTTDRCPSRICRSSSHSNRPRPSATSTGESSARARDEQGLGQRRVRVAEPGFRPRPSGCRAQACRPRRTAAVISARASTWPGTAASTSAAPSAANAMARGCGERRPAPRSKPASARSRRRGTRAHGGPQTPERAAPAVLDRRRVGPAQVEPTSVVEPTVGLLRRQHERQVLLAEVVQLTHRVVTTHDDQCPRHVVDAIAAFPTRVDAVRVLVQPARVGERAQMVVPRGRDVDVRRTHGSRHDASAMPAATIRVAIFR